MKRDDLDRIIGGNLRAIRIMRGMTQTTLGNAIGVTFQQIQKYEKGRNRIAASTLLLVAEKLAVRPEELLVR